jgi:hypothetical protein
MIETYYAKIVDVLPSRVSVSIPSDRGEAPIFRMLDSAPLMGVVELNTNNVMKITIETNPGIVTMKYEPAQRSDYRE